MPISADLPTPPSTAAVLDPLKKETLDHPISPEGKEIGYQGIPELTPADILPGCGIKGSAFHTQKYFIDYLVKALQNPDWVLAEPGSDEYNYRVEHDLPRPRGFIGADVRKRMNEGGDLTELAEEMNLKGSPDIVVRALELMAQDYPNLTFFRGTSYSESDLYTGGDFAPANLPNALSFAESHYNGKRENPVIAMMKFSDFVNAYTRDGVSVFSTEIPWWRGSLEIMPKREAKEKIVTLKRPPKPENMQAVLDAYRQQTIK